MSEITAAADGALAEPVPSRYVVGIDLGTTNSALCYVDTHRRPWRVELFGMPQLVAPGVVEAREVLPSFHYQPASVEYGQRALCLPWEPKDPAYIVGLYAREQGALAAGRMIASAKSWLCHGGIDRTAAILPWHAAEDVERLSPVEASACYLRHMRAAWDAHHPDSPLAEQDVVLTLPASFDEVARQLTVEAAARAGLPRVFLIEEPQAAFYAWIYLHAQTWEQLVAPGQTILVCDIGGGTTDFTLIRVRPTDLGPIQFHRVAVGDHLILGGDNLDLALAYHLEGRLADGTRLEPRQWDLLLRHARKAKETMLAEAPPEELHIQLPGSGSRLIGGALQTSLTRSDVEMLLVDGFFPRVQLDERPTARRSGFQEMGLPYAPDPAVTRNLAAFLTDHRAVIAADATQWNHDPARPDLVLLNGGVFHAPQLRRRLLDVLQAWFRTDLEPDWQPRVLEGDRYDLAVARGAAYFGMVRRGEGVRITAQLARAYYIGVAGEQRRAVCLLPGNTETGAEVVVDEPRFELLVSQPVEFPLYASSTRLTDAPGQLVEVDPEQLRALPPIRTVLAVRRRRQPQAIPVHLHARLSEFGTLELWCSDPEGDRRWQLEFDVRTATQTDVAAHTGEGEKQGVWEESLADECERLIAATFGPDGHDAPEGLVKRMAACLQLERSHWPMSLLRRVWSALLEHERGRGRSPTHETRWLNLAGFALRPGFGLAADDWRVAETWRTVQGRLAHATTACRNEAWILWRRIGGGLTTGQQAALAEPLRAPLRALHRRITGGRGSDATLEPQASAEAWRLVGSLELLDVRLKVELGEMVLGLLSARKMQPVRNALLWSLGRLGARVPVYGPLNRLVLPEVVARWISRLLALGSADPAEQLAVLQLSRRTDDRYRDIPSSTQQQSMDWLSHHAAPPHYVELVRTAGALGDREQADVFGESLPIGLRIG